MADSPSALSPTLPTRRPGLSVVTGGRLPALSDGPETPLSPANRIKLDRELRAQRGAGVAMPGSIPSPLKEQPVLPPLEPTVAQPDEATRRAIREGAWEERGEGNAEGAGEQQAWACDPAGPSGEASPHWSQDKASISSFTPDNPHLVCMPAAIGNPKTLNRRHKQP